jgi:hypothetical protein
MISYGNYTKKMQGTIGSVKSSQRKVRRQSPKKIRFGSSITDQRPLDSRFSFASQTTPSRKPGILKQPSPMARIFL